MENVETDRLRASVLALIAEERGADADYYRSYIEELESERTPLPGFFSSLLETFVHLDFSEEEALRHWARIVENSGSLRSKLGRPVGIHLAIVDYFTNVNPMLNAPMLVEIHVFKQTERLAMIDGLTGAFNRRYLDIALRKEFNRCERYEKDLSILLVDLDDFKSINDTKGHQYGDRVLKELTRYLKACVREEDAVCRYGGEEFLIILPETDARGAMALAERIRAGAKSNALFGEEGVTFSGGVATYPESAKDIPMLVRAAARALYQSKFAGKDRITLADPERRRYGRYPRAWTIEVMPGAKNESPSPEGPVASVLTQNVSLGGVQFACAEKFGIDAEVSIRFTDIDKAKEPVNAVGRISWVKRARRGYVYGVSFSDLPEFFEERLHRELVAIGTAATEVEFGDDI